MEPVTLRIVAAEKLNDGVVIKFDDGQCAFYSTLLLHTLLAQAEALDETKLAW